MLRELSIRNFAIIDDLRIRFADGLTILSGETGAGKSIIINAVNLMLGSRATADLVRTGADNAEIESIFEIPPDSPALKIMKDQGLDPSEELLIRRVIARNGRHRVYVNGRLSTMQMLGALTARQASISGQHAHQRLLKDDEYLEILDRFAALWPKRVELNEHYFAMLPKIQTLSSLRDLRDRQSEQLELLRFQKQEIEAAAFSKGEDTSLEQERQRLKHAEQLRHDVYHSVDDLYGAAGSVIERLSEVQKILAKAARLDATLAPTAEGIGNTAFQLEDLTRDLQGYLSGLEVDEERLEWVDERLDRLNRLKRKYGGSLEKVSERVGEIEAALSTTENLEERISALEKELAGDHHRLAAAASDLSAARKSAAEGFCLRVEQELRSLNMAQTQFSAQFDVRLPDKDSEPLFTTEAAIIGETGMDTIRFMIAPNVGEASKPLSAIASGGELSRVVLALKAILSGQQAVETIIFDEVDAGIGGGTADVVGQKLAKLGRKHQVICITHLPQIARFGNHHFRISKHVTNGRTITRITPLHNDDRIQEIARMLGGDRITPTTLDHARELLNRH